MDGNMEESDTEDGDTEECDGENDNHEENGAFIGHYFDN